MTSTDTSTVVVPGSHLMSALLGPRDQHLRQIERHFPDTTVTVRGNEIAVTGADTERVGRLFEELVGLLQRGHELDDRTIDRTLQYTDVTLILDKGEGAMRFSLGASGPSRRWSAPSFWPSSPPTSTVCSTPSTR